MNITSEIITNQIANLLPGLANAVRSDMLAGYERALPQEDQPRAKSVLETLIKNARMAEHDQRPLCQDTGTVRVLLEVGPGHTLDTNLFSDVDSVVSDIYKQSGWRMSTNRDSLLDRSNPHTNAPAFCHVDFIEEQRVSLHIILKGGGSDNASRMTMVPPGAGRAGIEEFLLQTVREKASSACPPLVVGLAVGGTFDTVGLLALKQLLRPVGSTNPNPQLNEYEHELLAKLNSTGMGPAGLGGKTTALALHLASAPSHIASMPVAVEMGCSAMRTASVDLWREERGNHA